METAKPIENEGRQLQAWLARERTAWLVALVNGREPLHSLEYEKNKDLEDRYRASRAKFRSKANLYRRRAETILAVLNWAAPDKQRERRLHVQVGSEDVAVNYHDEARPLIDHRP
jgi:hypothetical protein